MVQPHSPSPKGVLGDTDKETFSSISITKNPSDEKLHIQILYLHTGGMFSIQKFKYLYIRYRVMYRSVRKTDAPN